VVLRQLSAPERPYNEDADRELLGLNGNLLLLLEGPPLGALPPLDLSSENRGGESEWQLFEIRCSPSPNVTRRSTWHACRAIILQANGRRPAIWLPMSRLPMLRQVVIFRQDRGCIDYRQG
jgi:hypothetical protein